MAKIIEAPYSESDPRFLFEISLPMDVGSYRDIDSRINIAKAKIEGTTDTTFKERKAEFVQENANINAYEWINFSDEVACYFMWYLLVITSQDIKNGNKKPNKSLTFDTNAIFVDTISFCQPGSIPSFPNRASKFKNHTIVFLHYLFFKADIKGDEQREALTLIKEKYLDFKRSQFFKLTLNDNKDRAQWIEKKLESDGFRLSHEIPISNKIHTLSLAISLFLWDQRSLLSIHTLGKERCVSKSEYLHKLNLSWNQFKHRENNKRKKIKAYNFEMEESLQQKIDYLSKKLGMKKNKLIEHLVTKEYAEQHQEE
tara:strand:+ start:318 stop:1256 length:939 start_codon:yes stop_codon:yes gene_type:complete